MANKVANDSKKRPQPSSAKDSSEGHAKNKTNKKFKTSSSHASKHSGKKGSPSKSSSNQQQQTPRPRKNADIVEEGKKLWNQLRVKTNTKEETRKLMDTLMPLIHGKCREIALQHDASRIVQAAIQFGTRDERREILTELCAKQVETDDAQQSNSSKKKKSSTGASSTSWLVELCKSQYAHFVVLKVIQYCCTHQSSSSHAGKGRSSKKDSNSSNNTYDEVCVDMVIKSLKGHMAKLAIHAMGSRVIEALFTKNLPKVKLIALKQEFYGPHFALFATADTMQLMQMQQQKKDKSKVGISMPTLASNIQAQPDLKEKAIEFVRNIVQKGTEKSLYAYSYYQELFAEFLDYASNEEIRQLATTISDHCLQLLSTRAGTRVVCAIIAYGTAKDRKRITKCFKGYTRSGLLHDDAYLAILRLVQLTDDTVSIQKNILNEIVTATPVKTSGTTDPEQHVKEAKLAEKNDKENMQSDSPLLELASSKTASKLFLLLLENDDAVRNKFFDPYEISVLTPENPTVVENGADVPTSKKDPQIRRSELLSYLKKPLIELCINHAEALLRSRPGAIVLREVYKAFHPNAGMNIKSLQSVSRQDSIEGIVHAVVDVCLSSLEATTKKSNVDGNGTNSSDDSGDDEVIPLLEDRDGHLAVKNLILMDAGLQENGSNGDDQEETEEEVATISNALYNRLKERDAKESVMALASKSNRSAFVVAALCKVPSIMENVKSDLKQQQHTKALKSMIKDAQNSKHEKANKATAGYEALLKEIS